MAPNDNCGDRGDRANDDKWITNMLKQMLQAETKVKPKPKDVSTADNDLEEAYKKIRDAPGFRPILTKAQQEEVDKHLREIEKYKSSWRSKIPIRYNGFKKDCFFFGIFYVVINILALILLRVVIQFSLPSVVEAKGHIAHKEAFLEEVKGKWPEPLYKVAVFINDFFYSKDLTIDKLAKIFRRSKDYGEMNMGVDDD